MDYTDRFLGGRVVLLKCYLEQKSSIEQYNNLAINPNIILLHKKAELSLT